MDHPSALSIEPGGHGVCEQEPHQSSTHPEIEAALSRPPLTTNGESSDSKDTTATPKPTPLSKHHRGWRKIVRNFEPSWFVVNMGTGIVSTLLHNFPYHAHWLVYLSYIMFVLNVGLFLIFSTLTLVRYTLYPYLWKPMIRHPQQSLFLSTFPLALATIINMVVFACVPAWEGNTWKLAWGLWWIDAVLAVASCFYLPFVIMAVHHQQIETMTAIWIFPVVAPVLASATGGLVTGIMPTTHEQEKLITVVTSYVLFGTGFPMALIILVIYFLRLTTARLPPREAIVSTFIPLGPLGMGGFSLITLGKVSMMLFGQTHTLPASKLVYAGDFLYLLGFCIALMLWGFGLVWLFFALATIVRTPRFPFNMGWWGFVFPLGTYATSTNALAEELPSAFFRVLGSIFSVSVMLLWVVVAIGTLQRSWTGKMFYSPCLAEFEKAESARIVLAHDGGGPKEV
ncbi:Plasma membrane sulfite pump involved in sulfite metabolism [Elasticomyces elasticus]|nr:Plasma membrane sulfite pump involved in sulfite metabolism [Elasticomyces elasticus]KAK3667419.1 Plasma membrane sulfite pump involved in sulfite metabolism [Elasticomyces elasticus]KAK4915224.1 Plasma membrane sulfite pump involved in sulfite metabolism [Elasticomyces elasticus]KAK5760512.1 Plasma membrane sulfite pump involved in sulfite metabolism [Elasticomyces elasticus]